MAEKGGEESSNRHQPRWAKAHALELGLKAFLAKRGSSEKKIIRYGHNLDHLYREAVERGLDLPFISEAKQTIAWVNEYHDKGAVLRYGTTRKKLPACDTLFPMVDAIWRPRQHQSRSDREP